jgi:Domain of Unknown Function with PDB structure (DUF3857)
MSVCQPARCQQPAPPATEKPEAKPAGPETPAQIELLETHIRFEADGTSRKEVHVRVHINSELGVRQFSRLTFDFNRSYEQIEIPLVHITHASGGSADILPSAVTDQPNSAVAGAPAYQDVRVKSVRILGLEPSDVLEYRVITTGTAYTFSAGTLDPARPPDFWFDHSFNNTGVISREIFELDLPASRLEPAKYPATPEDPAGISPPQGALIKQLPQPIASLRIWSRIPETSKSRTEEKDSARVLYKWDVTPASLPKRAASSDDKDSDVALTTFSSWSDFSSRLGQTPTISFSTAEWTKFSSLYEQASKDPLPARVLYQFASKKIAILDLPFDAVRFVRDPYQVRTRDEVLGDGYGTVAQKSQFYRFLMTRLDIAVRSVFCAASESPEKQLPRPSLLTHALLVVEQQGRAYYLDPSIDVAPFGVIRADLRGKKVLDLAGCSESEARCWKTVPPDLPFASFQRVSVDAALAGDGTLNAKVKYTMRGDNELLLRVAFHQNPRDKWKELAQLLALSDGLRGNITSVSASDPTATKLPFTVEYEISEPKFVDWSKKPVRVPALLPQLGVPELPAKPESGAAPPSIDLGIPLDVDTRVTLRLPPGTSVEVPTGTVVDRDYATFASRYNVQTGVITASRHINFLHRQVPADRTADYAAFLHAVQTDQSQHFTLTRSDAAAPPATKKPTTHP